MKVKQNCIIGPIELKLRRNGKRSEVVAMKIDMSNDQLKVASFVIRDKCGGLI